MESFESVVQRNPHLGQYLQELYAQGRNAPEWTPTLSRELKSLKTLNHLYPVGDPLFVHVYKDPEDLFPHYRAVEPQLSGDERSVFEALRENAFIRAPEVHVPEQITEYREDLETLLAKVLENGAITTGSFFNRKRHAATPSLILRMRYLMFRDIVEHGPLEPMMRDEWIEDLHALGLNNLYVVHKIWGMMRTNVQFPNHETLDGYLRTMGERMGRPVSDTHPIVDGSLPNGSRINIVYSDNISKGGSSFTIRKFAETPVPVTQLIAWGTLSSRLAAYLWLCLENGMSVFVSGETASGKTTTLNGILPFIQQKSKILSVEDTPEVQPPHRNWQQLVTRERGKGDSSVSMQDLLKAALRSRPDYIIVGEIRGAEGAVAFQAMQSGHPTLSTFHAASVGKLIQRFSSDPINIPPMFMDNLNVTLIQMAVYVGGRMLRRVLAVEEIEGYSKRHKSVVTRQVFGWDSVGDQHQFPGRNNSYVLENLIAPRMAFSDPREIYAELERRTRILEQLVERKVFDYHVVSEFFADFRESEEKRSKDTQGQRPEAAAGPSLKELADDDPAKALIDRAAQPVEEVTA